MRFCSVDNETKLELFGHMDQRYAWRKMNEAYAEKNTLPTLKHGSGSVMLWGCFTSSCIGNLQRIGFNQVSGNTVRKCHALCEELGCHLTFQQDSDPKHTSKSTKAWFQKKSWKLIEWPSQSPDLNPTEHLWWDLKKVVVPSKPKNISELMAFAHDEWAKMPQERCQKLVSG